MIHIKIGLDGFPLPKENILEHLNKIKIIKPLSFVPRFVPNPWLYVILKTSQGEKLFHIETFEDYTLFINPQLIDKEMYLDLKWVVIQGLDNDAPQNIRL